MKVGKEMKQEKKKITINLPKEKINYLYKSLLYKNRILTLCLFFFFFPFFLFFFSFSISPFFLIFSILYSRNLMIYMLALLIFRRKRKRRKRRRNSLNSCRRRSCANYSTKASRISSERKNLPTYKSFC